MSLPTELKLQFGFVATKILLLRSFDGLSGFHAIRHAVFLDVEPDFPARGFGRRHQLADGIKQGADVFVVVLNLAFEVGELVRQFLVQRQCFAQAHEGAHDGDVDLHRARAAQHAGKHGNAFLREDEWQILGMLPAL